MEKDLVLSLDVGTSYLKVGLVDINGNLINSKRKKIKMIRNSHGRAEHDVELLKKSVLTTMKNVIDGYQNLIVAIVPSTYIFGIIAMNSSSEVLTNLITLADTRAKAVCEVFRKTIDENLLFNRTGFPATFHTPIYKVVWLKETFVKKAKVRNIKFLSCKDYVVNILTGHFLTEHSTASATGYMNIHKLEWDEKILNIIGISKDMLPEIINSMSAVEIRSTVKEFLGLNKQSRVVMGVYDGGAAAISGGVLIDDIASVNLGTTAMFRVLSDKPIISENDTLRLQTLYLLDNKWFPGGSVNNAGLVVEWLMREFGIDISKANNELIKLDKNLIFFPYLTGERGFKLNDRTSGCIVGISSVHTKEDLLVAALEGVTFTLKMMYELMEKSKLGFDEIVVSGSGAKSLLWLKILSNVFEKPVSVDNSEEPSLIGSAIIGFTAMGYYDSLRHATEKMINRNRKVIYPQKAISEFYREKYEKFKNMAKILFSTEGYWNVSGT